MAFMVSPGVEDVLPFRISPKHLQSQSHYLSRLLSFNGKLSGYNLQALFTHCSIGNSRHLDFPLSDEAYDELAHITTHSVESLRSTSLYYFLRKFGMQTIAKYSAVSFRGDISRVLRWCRPCLGRTRYFILPWRFVALKGCYLHSCEL